MLDDLALANPCPAHLNIRDEYLPYKNLIAEVILDKNPTLRTVINKVDDVGTHSQFRTFAYEVLCGPDDMNVEMSEENCVFKFDYSKVYWNSRLHTEHKRLVEMFNPGEVVCDVMAGIGPFAIPAGKKGVFVWANDLNPEAHEYMKEGVIRNKVSPFFSPGLFSPKLCSMMIQYHDGQHNEDLTLTLMRSPLTRHFNLEYFPSQFPLKRHFAHSQSSNNYALHNRYPIW